MEKKGHAGLETLNPLASLRATITGPMCTTDDRGLTMPSRWWLQAEEVEVEPGSNSIQPETLAKPKPESAQIAHITGP